MKTYGYTPAYFRNRKLTSDEGSILDKAFWKMFFATRDIKEVGEFWLTYFMMTTNMIEYFLEEKYDEATKVFRDTMEGQFEHNLYSKFFSNQLESDEDGIDTLQQRIKWCMVVIDRRGLIPHNVYDYTLGELFGLYRKAIDPEMPDLLKELRDRQIIQKEQV